MQSLCDLTVYYTHKIANRMKKDLNIDCDGCIIVTDKVWLNKKYVNVIINHSHHPIALCGTQQYTSCQSSTEEYKK